MKRLLNNKGLTLVEIIVTLSILGIVIVPLMSMFITSQKFNNESDMKYQAIQLAQEHMESIKAMDDLDTSLYPAKDGGVFGGEFSDANGYLIDVEIKKNTSITQNSVDIEDIPTNFDKEIKVDIVNPEAINVGGARTIKLEINVNHAKIIINGGSEDLKVYVYKAEYVNSYNIQGNARVIEVQEGMEKLDNYLYDIIIKVSKNGKLIDIIKGTTVFKLDPQ